MGSCCAAMENNRIADTGGAHGIDQLRPLRSGWYSEVFPGQAISLRVDELLWDRRSAFQHVVVFRNAQYGHVLGLDHALQLTERDECAYHEMIAHLPLFSHPNPQRVLVIGGGDGGVVREVLKHSSVTSVVLCEIDAMVVDVSKRFFGASFGSVWSDPRVELVIADAAVYVSSAAARAHPFDVIIVDSSDPVGPAVVLFQEPFYRAMSDVLSPGGRVATQAESNWIAQPVLWALFRSACAAFANAELASVQVPTYACGQIGLMLCCKPDGRAIDSCAQPLRSVPKEMDAQLRYYTTAMHAAAFVLPLFVSQLVTQIRGAIKPQVKGLLPPPPNAAAATASVSGAIAVAEAKAVGSALSAAESETNRLAMERLNASMTKRPPPPASDVKQAELTGLLPPER